MPEQRNWAGNLVYSAARVHAPRTVEELQQLVAGHQKLRAVGTRHSFNTIADTPADLVSTTNLDRVIAIDPERRTVTVEAGIRYGQLCRELDAAGFAIHNLASLPHISVAGACATATHGSGNGNGCLATAVSALELVTADGAIVRLSREQDGDRFLGAVVGLGALGIVTRLTLDLLPTFAVRQTVYENLPLGQLLDNFDAISGSAYSVSCFTDWQNDTVSQVWLKQRADADGAAETPGSFYGAMPAPTDRHPITRISPENCTAQLGVPGPWYDRLPHFRMDFLASSGDELQTEYLVPRANAAAGFRALDGLRERIAPVLQISEIRTIAADELWMSPFYQQACVALHFTWLPDWPAVRELLPALEAALVPLGAAPHWGKLFTMAPADIARRFPRLTDFRALVREFDPDGKFRNPFLDEYVFGTENTEHRT